MKELIIVGGPTAVGKTAYAIALAKQLEGEIISADSVQVYRLLDIGSAKPSLEERAMIPHHMIDVTSVDSLYTVADYAAQAKKVIDDVFRRGKQPIVVGGTGLYIHSLMYEMDYYGATPDETLRNKLNELSDHALIDYANHLKGFDMSGLAQSNRRRVQKAIEIFEQTGKNPCSIDQLKRTNYDIDLIILNKKRALLYNDIDRRVDQMMEMGLLNEVRQIVQKYGREIKSLQSIGYRELKDYAWDTRTERTLIPDDIQEQVMAIKKHSRNYAKRQITWFRRYNFAKWMTEEV